MSERDQITLMLHEKHTLGEIAKALGRSKSTISRELQRNSSPEYKLYLSHRAHARALVRREHASRRPRLKDERIVAYVQTKLEEGWSPEQISGRIRIDFPGLSISHEAIYQYIYDPQTPCHKELIQCLRQAHRKRKTKGIGRKERKTKIPNRIPIDQRPHTVETRHQPGHWESDTLISRKSLAALHSMVERKSRLLMLTKLNQKSASCVSETIIQRFKNLPPGSRRTLTMDNGTENANHETITATLGTQCYFTHPYASWERGTNEHTNGLVRWYLPKDTDFNKILTEHIAKIESLLNNRPRKCLGFKTPLEVASSFVALRG